jgi:hypothetical protein
MTKIQISLHDGMVITIDVEDYNASELSAMLNDQKLLMVNIGQIIINKNAVKLIIPVQAA